MMAATAAAAAFLWTIVVGPIAAESENQRRVFVLASAPTLVAGVCIAIVGRQFDNVGAVGFGGCLVLCAVLIFSVEAMRYFADKAGL